MNIQLSHEGERLCAVVTPNLHNTNIIMVKLRTPVSHISEVLFFMKRGNNWICDAPLEWMHPATYSSLVTELDLLCSTVAHAGRKMTPCY